jgi:hypothetical protein
MWRLIKTMPSAGAGSKHGYSRLVLFKHVQVVQAQEQQLFGS